MRPEVSGRPSRRQRALNYRRDRLRKAESCARSARAHLSHSLAHALLGELAEAKQLANHAAQELRDARRVAASVLA